MQHPTTDHPGAVHPATPDALLSHHARLRLPGHRRGAHGHPEFPNRISEAPGEVLPFLQLPPYRHALDRSKEQGNG